jgi:hypothetical protein
MLSRPRARAHGRARARGAVPVLCAGIRSPYWCLAMVGIVARALALLCLATPLPDRPALPLLFAGIPADLILGLTALAVAASRVDATAE